MKKRGLNRYFAGALVGVAVIMLGLGTAYAETSSSEHYRVNEVQFGSGSSLNSCSGEYCSKQGVGDLTVGRADSENYQAHLGFITANEPYIDVWTDGAMASLGVLDVNTTATAMNVIKVRNYMSAGYVIQITGSPPSQGTHALEAISIPSTSHAGAEQFGINMVDNTSPNIGANPVQIPDSEFSFGAISADYSTPDLFKYDDGDIVAQSDRSSGETDYTMSLIINISNVTPGGKYTGAFSAVVVPTY